MGDTVVGLSAGGNGGGGGVIAVVLIVIVFLFIWMWRSGAFQQQPGAAAPAQAPPPQVGAQKLPPFSSCNCASSSSCNAFCGNTAMFNLCCFGTQTPPATVPPTTTPPTNEAPADPNVQPNPSICDSVYDGSCNVECGANGDLDTCAECNSTCESEILYTGPGSEEEEDGTAGAAVPSCPSGYTYNVQTNLCVATAAPSYPSTPIPPPLTSQA